MNQQPFVPNSLDELYQYYISIYDYIELERSAAINLGNDKEALRNKHYQDMLDNVLKNMEVVLHGVPNKKPHLTLVKNNKNGDSQ